MSLQRLGKVLYENIPTIGCVSVIIAVHWTWHKIQDVPHLVPESQQRNDIPLISAIQCFYKVAVSSFSGSEKSNKEKE